MGGHVRGHDMGGRSEAMIVEVMGEVMMWEAM